MNRILFVGPVTHHHLLRFTTNLFRYSDLLVDALLVNYLKISDSPYNKIFNPFCNRRFFKSVKNPIVFFRLVFIIFKMNKYDVIQFHFFSKMYLLLLPFLVSKGRFISIFIWGSDFYRNSFLSKFVLKCFIYFVDEVICDSELMCSDLKKFYPPIQCKIKYLSFGSDVLDIMKKYPITRLEAKNKLSIRKDDIVIVVGYNLSQRQNHLDVIKNISKFERFNLCWVFPISYGGCEEYKKIMIEELAKINCNYKLIDRFLSDEEMSILRYASDIFIHIQDSDAFSSSITESLYARTILLNGEWIKYNELDNNNVYYVNVTKNNLISKLEFVLLNFDAEYGKTIDNPSRVWALKSWECNIKYWIDNYNRI